MHRKDILASINPYASIADAQDACLSPILEHDVIARCHTSGHIYVAAIGIARRIDWGLRF